MNNLICSVNTCTHNQNNLCCRESIRVAGKNTINANNISIEGSYALSEIQTECGTFESRIDR